MAVELSLIFRVCLFSQRKQSANRFLWFQRNLPQLVHEPSKNYLVYLHIKQQIIMKNCLRRYNREREINLVCAAQQRLKLLKLK